MAPDSAESKKIKTTINTGRQEPMKRLLLLFVLLCLLPAPTITAGGGKTAGGEDLLLFYSNDVAGETEPCG
jgi:hypothetical protein